MNTKEQIADTAESLFAENGFNSTPIRTIASKAGVNVAAVNYHFGSKEKLLKRIIKERLTPLNRRRLETLKQQRSEHGGSPIPVRNLLEILIVPAMELWISNPNFMKLAGRLYYEPDRGFRAYFLSQFRTVAEQLNKELTGSLPGISKEDLMWRTFFIVGSMIHIWTCSGDIKHITGNTHGAANHNTLTDKLMTFGIAGLKASGKSAKKRRKK